MEAQSNDDIEILSVNDDVDMESLTVKIREKIDDLTMGLAVLMVIFIIIYVIIICF